MTEHRTDDLSEDEKEEAVLLERLRALEPGAYLDPDKDHPLFGQLCMHETAAKLLASGEPVYFQCCEGAWVSFMYSDGIGFYYARQPQELDSFRELLLEHKAQVDDMLRGLDKAQRRLTEGN